MLLEEILCAGDAMDIMIIVNSMMITVTSYALTLRFLSLRNVYVHDQNQKGRGSRHRVHSVTVCHENNQTDKKVAFADRRSHTQQWQKIPIGTMSTQYKITNTKKHKVQCATEECALQNPQQ